MCLLFKCGPTAAEAGENGDGMGELSQRPNQSLEHEGSRHVGWGAMAEVPEVVRVSGRAGLHGFRDLVLSQGGNEAEPEMIRLLLRR